MSSYFKKKGLSLADIGFKTSSRIYINESLTKLNREIFNSAAQAKRLRNLHKYFTRRGLVYVQMAIDSATICVESVGKLNEIISEYESLATGQNLIQSTNQSIHDNCNGNKSSTSTQFANGSMNWNGEHQMDANFEQNPNPPSM